MQTILGAGGAVGNELAKALIVFTTDIRLVSRSPKKVNPADSLFAADLTHLDEVRSAVAGSEVVYLTVGLPYNTKVWQKTWPLIMQNVITACLESKCRLVFFDNIYMYDGSHLDPITELTPISPSSKKGKVRADIVRMLWDAVAQNGLIALVARCADYYGPSIENTSILTETVFEPLSQGKTANWLISDQFKHSFTYTPDAGNATAILGNTPDAFGETWHLPTADKPLKGIDWIMTISQELGVKPKYRTVNRFMVSLLGLFIPVMRESHEMLYQYDKDYIFSSDKFENRFNFKPTPYLEGIREIVRIDYHK